MKVKFFAYYRDIFGSKQMNINSCNSVIELRDYLCEKYGKKAENIFYKNGQISDEIIIMVNGRHIKHLDGLETNLKETDTVALFPVVAGG